jgi:hypothetical protein
MPGSLAIDGLEFGLTKQSGFIGFRVFLASTIKKMGRRIFVKV